jgi:hypothetical protein
MQKLIEAAGKVLLPLQNEYFLRIYSSGGTEIVGMSSVIGINLELYPLPLLSALTCRTTHSLQSVIIVDSIAQVSLDTASSNIQCNS